MRDRKREQEPRLPADPSGIEEPHDVLAAEEFGIGTRDERHPPDPTGIEEPHDVLAAEEFPMPSPADHPEHTSGSPDPRALLPLALLGAAAGFLLLRRLSRR
jgi:hypothetical protein